jgi:hypothetical protein
VLLLDVKANKRPSGSLQGSRFLFLFLFLLLTFTQPSESAALRALIAKGGLLGRRKRPAPVVEAEEDSGPLAEEEGVLQRPQRFVLVGMDDNDDDDNDDDIDDIDDDDDEEDDEDDGDDGDLKDMDTMTTMATVLRVGLLLSVAKVKVPLSTFLCNWCCSQESTSQHACCAC